ncbi:MAG TPA: hypothetical protein PKI93_01945 [Alphaproteobacteria bacterium]|nr:hypothetical protein [Alphaproteobacteria bacterium]
MLRLVFSRGAVSIWNNQKGPVFWYAAGVPGPFYVNTEKLIGKDVADKLLSDINGILQKSGSAAEKAEELDHLVMGVYSSHEEFQRIVKSMVKKGEDFSYDCVSGGERRDWFFSIPFSHEVGKDHLYIFKDMTVFRRKCEGSGSHDGVNALHIADLINNAASYFDKWLPAVAKNNMNIVGTISVINRGNVGMDRLSEAGVRSCALKCINVSFFLELAQKNLISQSTYEEIQAYFDSKEEWAKRYILSNPALFNVKELDAKSKERLEQFVSNDPWNLKDYAPETFAKLKF